MSQTFAQWKTQVRAAYQGGEPTRAWLLMAVKNFAMGVMKRDVESDLPLAKSYRDEFSRSAVKMAGTRLTDDVPTLVAAITPLIPVEADVAVMQAALENAIEAARDEINAMADKWDAFLIQAAIFLQEHVPAYQVRQMETILADSAGVTTTGFVSILEWDLTRRLQQVWYGHYYEPLEADVEYESDDIVVSNGRLYRVVDGGELTVYDIGDGLTSTNGEIEELGTLTFRYYGGDRDWPVRNLNWGQRQQLLGGQNTVGTAYAIPEQCDQIWLYPKLDDTHRFDIEWVGVAEEFEDTDTVNFDQTAAEAAAHYLLSKFAETEQENARLAAAEYTLFQLAVRKAVVANQARETGSGRSVAPYDWTRRPRLCGTVCASNTVVGLINDYFELTNRTDETTTISNTARNMTVGLTFTGTAGNRTVVLKSSGYSRGDQLTLVCSFPLTEGIVLNVTNGAGGSALLPTERFPDQVYTSDGLTQNVTLEFVWNGHDWEYEDASIPA